MCLVLWGLTLTVAFVYCGRAAGFPRIALRTLRSPVYLLVVLAQVNLAALLSGLATFMAKFLEWQFSQTVSNSTMMIGESGGCAW